MVKIAIITGASKGLGFETAKQFAANGWQVVGTGRSERPDVLPESIEYVQFDASISEECKRFWQTTMQKYSSASVCLVNNAGGYLASELVATSSEDIYKMMNTNYFTAVNMTRAMVEVTPTARIINVISSTANMPEAKHTAYGASKAAEKYFFQALQQELKPNKYKITNLYPKSIATHDSTPYAIDPADLAAFIVDQSQSESSYYLRDVTLFPA